MAPDPTAACAEGARPLLAVQEDHSELAPAKLPQAEALAARARQAVKWNNVVMIIAMHVWLLHCLTVMPAMRWQTWLWFFFLWTWAGFGVTGGAHRLWSHRSYKANLPLRIILMLGNNMSGMYCVFDWVRDHRVHHRFSETDADPHNASRGFFFAHIGWIMLKKHPEVVRNGRKLDMSDIEGDPVCAFEKRHQYKLLLVTCFAVPIIVPVLWWGETWACAVAMTGARWVLEVNAILSINSFAHMYGGRPFNKSIAPAQNPLVSVFSMGEGWHNYHHVFPWDYRASEFGFLNPTMQLLALAERAGWAWGLKTASPALVQRVAQRYGDGSHPHAAHAPEVPEEAERDHSLVDALPPPPPPVARADAGAAETSDKQRR